MLFWNRLKYVDNSNKKNIFQCLASSILKQEICAVSGNKDLDGRHIKIWPTAILIKDQDSSLTLIQQNRKHKEQYCNLLVQEHILV